MKLFSDIVFENAINDCLVYIRQRVEKYKKTKAIINEVIKITSNSND